MSLFHSHSVTVDVCSRCHSVWLDPDEFEQLLAPTLRRASTSDNATDEVIDSILSETDILSPLIDAALDGLFSGL